MQHSFGIGVYCYKLYIWPSTKHFNFSLTQEVSKVHSRVNTSKECLYFYYAFSESSHKVRILSTFILIIELAVDRSFFI